MTRPFAIVFCSAVDLHNTFSRCDDLRCFHAFVAFEVACFAHWGSSLASELDLVYAHS